jgi:hypothetical protein
VVLADGRVLVAGGGRTTELYDPATDTWTRGADLTVARSSSALVKLADGRPVLVGDTSAEVYDPTRGRWTLTGELQLPRTRHAALALPDNTALVAGGTAFYSSWAERFVPVPLDTPADAPAPTGPGVVEPVKPSPGVVTGVRGTLTFVRPLPKRVSGGRLTVKLRCSGGACGDTLTLRDGKSRLASKRFSVRQGGTVTVRLRLRTTLPKRATAVKFSLTRQKASVSGKLRR